MGAHCIAHFLVFLWKTKIPILLVYIFLNCMCAADSEADLKRVFFFFLLSFGVFTVLAGCVIGFHSHTSALTFFDYSPWTE